MNNQLMLNPPGKINFYTNPFQVRKWLCLLEDDKDVGFRIKPNLLLQRRTLGFSFCSNALGLRGPGEQKADNLILGTSYAMSFTVDNGKNWYDHGFDTRNWLNLGLPVGLPQIEELFKRYYRGNASVVLVLYHPNYWVTTRNYEKWRENGRSVFETFHWEQNLRRCLRLYARKVKRLNQDLQAGRVLIFNHSGIKYHVNAEYNYFEFDKLPGIVSMTIQALQRMITRFARAIVVRTQIKQEVVPGEHQNDILCRTLESYRVGWNLLQSGLKQYGQVEYYEASQFGLDDFQPWDTHWNEKGNRKFSLLIHDIL